MQGKVMEEGEGRDNKRGEASGKEDSRGLVTTTVLGKVTPLLVGHSL